MGISRVIFLLSIAITMAMFVVSERNSTIEIGYQIAKLQKSCVELSEKNRKLAYDVDNQKSPNAIACKVQFMKLALNPQEEFRGTLVASRTKLKEDTAKIRVNKTLVTQKEPATTGRSLHY